MPLTTTFAGASVRSFGFYTPLTSAKYAYELVAPTSLTTTGTSASINTNGSVTFTAVSSLSLNGVFSAEYENYHLVLEADVSTTNVQINGRLRQGTTDSANTALYNNQRTNVSGTNLTSAGSTNAGLFNFDLGDGATRNGLTITIYRPFIAEPTALHAQASMDDATIEYVLTGCTHEGSTSFDGFTFSTGSGNMTGTVAVYGFGF